GFDPQPAARQFFRQIRHDKAIRPDDEPDQSVTVKGRMRGNIAAHRKLRQVRTRLSYIFVQIDKGLIVRIRRHGFRPPPQKLLRYYRPRTDILPPALPVLRSSLPKYGRSG